jgi:mono/diheme cytochrome c family protein
MKSTSPIAMGIILLAGAVAFSACQGRPSDQPPIHLNPNMSIQPKYKPQSKAVDLIDGQTVSTMRIPVSGTVARGELREDDRYFTGKDDKGKDVVAAPVAVTMDLLKRGQDRYAIYCSPCHGQTGRGNGIVVQRGMLPPPTYHSDLMRNFPDGHFFDVITNGIRNMPSYRSQVPVADRWAIVSYIRALQRSENAKLEDVPQEKRKELK